MKFRRSFFLNVSLLILFTFFAALICVCAAHAQSPENSKNSPTLDKKAELVVWTGFEAREQETIEAIAHRFRKEKGVQIRIINVSFFDLKKKVLNAQKSGKGPDIFISPNDWIGEFAGAGAVSPLTSEEFSKEFRDKFNPVGVHAVTYNGKVYGYPFFLETVGIVYNKALVKESPKTMKDLLKTAAAFNNPKAGRYGFLFEFNNLFASWPVFAGFGSNIFVEKDGKIDIALDSPESLQALRYLTDIKTTYSLISGIMKPEDMENRFAAGNVQFIVTGPWALKKFRRSLTNYGIMDFPPLENGNKPKPFVSVHAFLLSTGCRNRPLAIEFMQYLNSGENQLSFSTIDNRIPGRNDVLASLEDYPEVAVFAKIAGNGVPVPNYPEMAHVWEPMDTALVQVVLREKNPEAVLRTQVKEIRLKANRN